MTMMQKPSVYIFKKDTSSRYWIVCDGPCQLLPHQTCIPNIKDLDTCTTPISECVMTAEWTSRQCFVQCRNVQ